MLTAIFGGLAAIFGSGGFGTLIGGATGLFNKWLDQRNRQMEMTHEQARWAHDLLVKDKDIEYAKAEAAGRRDVAIVEGTATIEAEAYKAMASAYASDRVSDAAWEGTRGWQRGVLVMLEALNKSVRPIVTYAFLVSVLYMNWRVVHYLGDHWMLFDAVQKTTIAQQVIGWTLLQAGAAFGYWFVMRPTPAALKG